MNTPAPAADDADTPTPRAAADVGVVGLAGDPEPDAPAYHVVLIPSPPHSGALPGSRSDAEAQDEAVGIAIEHAATVQLYCGPDLLGSASADGTFTPAPPRIATNSVS